MRKSLLFFLVLLSTAIFAQKKNENFKMHIKQSTGAIKIDGVLDENAWFQAAAVSDFMMCNPFDTLCAQLRTDVKMAYDDKYIYISAECFLKDPGAFVVESMKRDFGNELAGKPSQGWIRPSVAPGKLPRELSVKLLDVLHPCHPARIYQ